MCKADAGKRHCFPQRTLGPLVKNMHPGYFPESSGFIQIGRQRGIPIDFKGFFSKHLLNRNIYGFSLSNHQSYLEKLGQKKKSLNKCFLSFFHFISNLGISESSTCNFTKETELKHHILELLHCSFQIRANYFIFLNNLFNRGLIYWCVDELILLHQEVRTVNPKAACSPLCSNYSTVCEFLGQEEKHQPFTCWALQGSGKCNENGKQTERYVIDLSCCQGQMLQKNVQHPKELKKKMTLAKVIYLEGKPDLAYEIKLLLPKVCAECILKTENKAS